LVGEKGAVLTVPLFLTCIIHYNKNSMEQVFLKAEELAQHVKEYANNRIDQLKLSSAEKTAKLLSNLIAVFVVVALIVFFILFVAVALSLLMGEVFGATYLGFLFTGGILLLFAVIIWVFKSTILQLPIMNSIIGQLFTETEEEDEED
jgi:protein-S-isoprenylcysteine O-methyltransferase Ste14